MLKIPSLFLKITYDGATARFQFKTFSLNPDVDSANYVIDIEKEDTLTILERYVDDLNHSDKPALKSILKSLYVEALELV